MFNNSIENIDSNIVSKVQSFLKHAMVKPSYKTNLLYLRLQTEEKAELLSALSENSLNDVLDGIGDSLFVGIARIELFGVKPLGDLESVFGLIVDNLNETPLVGVLSTGNETNSNSVDEGFRALCLKCVDAVCDSNLSKFDKSDSDAEKTRKQYLDIGIKSYTIADEGFFATFSLEDQSDKSGKSFPKDKLLKSATSFKHPDFSFIKDFKVEAA